MDVKKFQERFIQDEQADADRKARQSKLESNFHVYLAVYFTAKKCSDSSFVFNEDVVGSMTKFIKIKAQGVPQDLKDKAWEAMQNRYASIVVNEQDCSQAMQQAQYIFPQGVLGLKDAPKNPF